MSVECACTEHDAFVGAKDVEYQFVHVGMGVKAQMQMTFSECDGRRVPHARVLLSWGHGHCGQDPFSNEWETLKTLSHKPPHFLTFTSRCLRKYTSYRDHFLVGFATYWIFTHLCYIQPFLNLQGVEAQDEHVYSLTSMWEIKLSLIQGFWKERTKNEKESTSPIFKALSTLRENSLWVGAHCALNSYIRNQEQR